MLVAEEQAFCGLGRSAASCSILAVLQGSGQGLFFASRLSRSARGVSAHEAQHEVEAGLSWEYATGTVSAASEFFADQGHGKTHYCGCGDFHCGEAPVQIPAVSLRMAENGRSALACRKASGASAQSYTETWTLG